VKYDPDERALISPIWERLKAAGQIRYSRGFPPHPAFKGIDAAARRLLGHLSPDHVILSMRDQCLLPFLRLAIEAGCRATIPDKAGRCIYRIPPSSLHHEAPGGLPKALRLHPLPFGAEIWRGRIDLVVVACTAWSAGRPRLWTLDLGLTASTLELLRDGFPSYTIPLPGVVDAKPYSWRLEPGVPVVCLAADEQEVPPDSWPSRMAGHAADVVVTPTRTVILGNDGATAPGTN
jgi:hypothetical protein